MGKKIAYIVPCMQLLLTLSRNKKFRAPERVAYEAVFFLNSNFADLDKGIFCLSSMRAYCMKENAIILSFYTGTPKKRKKKQKNGQLSETGFATSEGYDATCTVTGVKG